MRNLVWITRSILSCSLGILMDFISGRNIMTANDIHLKGTPRILLGDYTHIQKLDTCSMPEKDIHILWLYIQNIIHTSFLNSYEQTVVDQYSVDQTILLWLNLFYNHLMMPRYWKWFCVRHMFSICKIANDRRLYVLHEGWLNKLFHLRMWPHFVLIN